MQKVWLYGRDSVKDVFPASQLEELHRYAEENQLKIVGVSFDTCGWESLDRKGLNEAIQAINDKEANAILVVRLNRISKSIEGAKAFAELIGEPDRLIITDADDTVAWDAMKGELFGAESPELSFGSF